MKIYEEVGSIENLDTWGGATDVVNAAIDRCLEEDLMADIEDVFPNGASKKDVNDLLWFDKFIREKYLCDEFYNDIVDTDGCSHVPELGQYIPPKLEQKNTMITFGEFRNILCGFDNVIIRIYDSPDAELLQEEFVPKLSDVPHEYDDYIVDDEVGFIETRNEPWGYDYSLYLSLPKGETKVEVS